jgi:hypothetical protein
MAVSELQIALVGAGAAAVALVWGYNAWQDRQHRKTAERIFKGGHDDALLGDEPVAATEPPVAVERLEPGERLEPRLPDLSDEVQEPVSEMPAVEAAAESLAHAAAEPAPWPAMPAEYADGVADCVLRLMPAEPLPAPAVWAVQNTWAAELSKPLRWLARIDADSEWQVVDSHDAGRYAEWAAALQLVDRRGPVSDGELARYFDGVQRLAQQTSAALELPSRGEVVMRAAALDEFCAGVDIQFVLHVVAAGGGVFAGTKLRGVAEAAGLVLAGDGVFRARDDAGGELFTVSNLGAERLDADSIKSLATQGLTLSLDVPRVTDGVAAFDRMLAVARQFATALGGALVDAQRAPLSDAMIVAIRAKTLELQQRMRDGGIAPGGTRALRLFS